MGFANPQSVAFSVPGGETCGLSSKRPIDLSHLSRQTMGDRALEREVLALFVQQAVAVSVQIDRATPRERGFMAHGLRGSAAGVGAFLIAETAAAIENDPTDMALVPRLIDEIADVRQFIAAINR
ncbi:MAG: histidine kinase [Mesorhizobium sp.]